MSIVKNSERQVLHQREFRSTRLFYNGRTNKLICGGRLLSSDTSKKIGRFGWCTQPGGRGVKCLTITFCQEDTTFLLYNRSRHLQHVLTFFMYFALSLFQAKKWAATKSGLWTTTVFDFVVYYTPEPTNFL